MELRVLRYFLAAARAGSITGAANALHLTQPTLSRQLAELENQLGCKLFVRSSHSVKLTSEGLLLQKRAGEILDLAERTRSEISEFDADEYGNVHIGCGETRAIRHVAKTIRTLQKRYPHVKYHFYSGNASDVTEKLDKGLLDFGLLIQPVDLSKYGYIDLPDKDTWGVLMRKDCALASKRRIRPADIEGLPLIVSRQLSARASAKNDLADWFTPRAINISATYNLIYNASVMVSEGLGYAISLDGLADTGESSNLCFRPLSPKVEAAMSIVWKKDRYFSAAARRFLDALKEYIGEKW